MAKVAIKVALIFLLFAISQAQNDDASIEEKSETLETTQFEQKLDGNDESTPLTIISFRPAHRHFRRGQFPLTFRRGRRCGHWGRRPHDRVSYGNDMILSSEGRGLQMADRPGGFDPELRPMDHDGSFGMPPRHHRRHRHHDHPEDFDDDDEFDRPRPRPHPHHHDHDHPEDFDDDDEFDHRRPHPHHHDHHHHHHHHHHDHENVFFKIRKFLGDFF